MTDNDLGAIQSRTKEMRFWLDMTLNPDGVRESIQLCDDNDSLVAEVERLRAEMAAWRCDNGGAHRWQLIHVGLRCIDCQQGPSYESDEAAQ